MNSKQQTFFVVGHRGAAGDYFENSMSAFEHAHELSIDAIELDIHEHHNQFWVFHDPELDRLTNGSGHLTHAEDLSVLQLNNGESIPTLPQVLDLLWGKIAINIEIKSIRNSANLLKLLDSYPPLGDGPSFPSLLISSFNHRLLYQLREQDCHWPLAPISHGVPAEVDRLLERIKPWSWHFDNEYVDFDLVSELREQDINSLVYTVNNLERATELHDNGIVGVFTDYPALFAQSR